MGYTTNFTGAIELSRTLTFAEAEHLLLAAEIEPGAKADGRPDTWLQWVPSTDLKHIVWDCNEKFYDYAGWLEWVCRWLWERGIEANGTIHWSGEGPWDIGTLFVRNSVVHVAAPESPGRHRPLTLRELRRLREEAAAAAMESPETLAEFNRQQHP